jgi:hypothetical protein
METLIGGFLGGLFRIIPEISKIKELLIREGIWK